MARDGASDKGKATLVGRFFTALDDVGSVSQAAFKKASAAHPCDPETRWARLSACHSSTASAAPPDQALPPLHHRAWHPRRGLLGGGNEARYHSGELLGEGRARGRLQ